MQLSTIEMMVNVCLVGFPPIQSPEWKDTKVLMGGVEEHANDDGNYSTRNLLLTIISNFHF